LKLQIQVIIAPDLDLNFDGHFTESEIEKLCFRFGGALLIPEATFGMALGDHRHNLAVQELISIKETYGISVHAIMARARNLGVISESRYRQFCISISKNKKEIELGA